MKKLSIIFGSKSDTFPWIQMVTKPRLKTHISYRIVLYEYSFLYFLRVYSLIYIILAYLQKSCSLFTFLYILIFGDLFTY